MRRADRAKADYAELVDDAKEFLAGKSTGVQARLGKQMAEAAEKQDYRAGRRLSRPAARADLHPGQPDGACRGARRRRHLRARLQGRGDVHPGLLHPRRPELGAPRLLPGAHRRRAGGGGAVELPGAILRGGAAAAADPASIATCPSASCSSEALCERAGRKVEIERPQRGDRAQADRAGEAQRRGSARPADGRDDDAGASCCASWPRRSSCPTLPKRIEVYDNSHIMGTNATGAMIVAGPEGFRKNSYRKFNIKSGRHAGRRFRDDARGAGAALRPAGEGGSRPAERRMAGPAADRRRQGPDCRRSARSWRMPGVHDVPVVGVAKGPDRNAGREIFHLPGGREITLPPNSALLFYLQRLRDEAHRFAIGTHRAKRAKSLTTSTLDEVPGHRPEPQAGAADALRHGAGGQGRGARRSRARAGHQQGDGAPALRLFPPARLMRISTPAIVCALRDPWRAWRGRPADDRRSMGCRPPMSAARGAGGCGRCWSPGNLVEARLRRAPTAQLAAGRDRAGPQPRALAGEPLPAAAIEWATALTATALARGRSPIRGCIRRSTACSPRSRQRPRRSGWGAALVRYELLLLAELGFGLDLERCAVSGANDDLVAVSPRSGRAVSAAEAEPYAGKLLAASAIRARRRAADWVDIARRAGADGPFPDARRPDRPVGRPCRSAVAAGRAAAPGRRRSTSRCLRGPAA